MTDETDVTLALEVSDATGVDLVRAAGFTAVLGPDSLWRVSVPLSVGLNTIRVETRDTLGHQDSNAALLSIRRGSALWIEPSGLAMDAVGDALVLDPLMQAVLRVRPSGARSVISGPGNGSDAALASPRDMESISGLDAVAVTDGLLDAVILVDLGNGSRTVLSSPSVGGGPTPLDLQGIALDLLRNRVLVLDGARSELMGVDLLTGQRATVSSPTVGSGVSLITPRRLALDPTRNRALVTLESTRVIVAVDLTTGNRTVLSGGTTGSGPAFVTPFDLAVDMSRDRALVTDLGARAILEVDLDTGTRRVFSSRTVGNGPDFLAPAGVALRFDGVPLVIDSEMNALVEVAFGDRRIVSSLSGSAPLFGRPVALASSLASPERLAVAEPTALFVTDDVTGDWELLSGSERGAGTPFREISAVVLSRGPRPCITVLEVGNPPGLIGVDRVSGGRLRISGGGVGSGPALSRPRCMVLEPSVVECSSSALVVDQPLGAPASILRVNLITGTRSIVSDTTHGTGPDIVDPVAIEIDLRPLEAFALVFDQSLQAVFSVDLFSGDREVAFLLTELPGIPMGLAIEGRRLLVTIADPPALLALEDQAVTVLCDATVGAGPALGRLSGLELTPVAGGSSIAYALDTARSTVVAMDTTTGDRVICAK